MLSLSPELRAFLKPGLAGVITAADQALRPHVARVWAARYLDERAALELYVQREGAARLLAAIGAGGRAAATFVELPSYRSRAFKGRCTPSNSAIDPAFLDGCLAATNASFEAVGLRPTPVTRMLGHFRAPRDMVGLWLEVDRVFDQSPKPGAGAQL